MPISQVSFHYRRCTHTPVVGDGSDRAEHVIDLVLSGKVREAEAREASLTLNLGI